MNATALVTGATDGIGRATAAALLERGARVIVHGRDQARIDKAVRELREAGGGERVLPPVRADFARLDEVRAMAAELCARDHRVDFLVNNAGVFMNERVL